MKSGAERQKLRRIREALGLSRAVSWPPPAFVEYLILIGAITADDALDAEELGAAILTWAIAQAEEVRGRKFA